MPTAKSSSLPKIPVEGSQLKGDAAGAFANAVVGFFIAAAEPLGIPKSVASIYGVIFASPTPVSFAHIESRLDLSKGSISQGLKALREVGAVKEVSTPADRAELFVPDTEMRRLIEGFLESRVQPQLNAGKERLESLRQMADQFPASQQKVLRQRVEKLEQWHGRTRGLLPLVRTFLKLGAS